MVNQNDEDIRFAAEYLIQNTNNHPMARNHPMSRNDMMMRGHPINLITEEFLGGYRHDGRMSVVRRFFCLFVTFDLVFISLLWLICILITGANIWTAFEKQIIEYSIYKSLFDIVLFAIGRFIILIFFYGLLYMNHWIIIAFSTSSSCIFLISKVFFYTWNQSNQQVLEVVLIITSFVLSWGEAWFLDCRVFPQELYARYYFSDTTSNNVSPIVPLLREDIAPALESVVDFYSPLDSAHSSEDEHEEDEEYSKMGLACVQRTFDLLESSDWKIEKVTAEKDTIHSMQHSKLGKVYRLTAHIKFPAKALLEEMFYKIEDIPKWNPTVLESRLVRKINSYTDITYQATASSGGGLIKSRDFVNLRCWRLYINNTMTENNDDVDVADNESEAAENNQTIVDNLCEENISTQSSVVTLPGSLEGAKSLLSCQSFSQECENQDNNASLDTLSKSLGARGFGINIDFNEPPPLENLKQNSDQNLSETASNILKKRKLKKDKVWISAAVSVPYAKIPPNTKYTRGENLVSGFSMREIHGKPACIMEWIICLDLKGFIPRYVLDTAYTSFMSDYMIHLRKYVKELRRKQKHNTRPVCS